MIIKATLLPIVPLQPGWAIEISLATYVIFFTAILPTLLHALYTVFLMSCKLARGLLSWPTNIVVLRLHESKQGVLTQIAVAIGLLAKFIQEFFKYKT